MENYIVKSAVDILPTIEKYGVAILENVLNESECRAMLNGAWDFFEQLHPEINRNDETTWRNIHDLKPLHGMLIQYWGIGHAQYIWDLRYNPKIIEIFRVIWRTITNEDVTDMKVSFDGASFGLPPEVTNRGWNKKDWFHVDQSYIKEKGLKCIQSWVTSEDVTENDATLSVLKGSNLKHDNIQLGTKDDWYRLSDEELREHYSDCERIDITCKAGSMVFWDSRTVHLGRGPIKNRETPKLRNVVYICYMPASMISKNILKKRLKAFEELRTTNHWPNKAKLFPKYPRCYPNDEIKQSLKDHINPRPVLPDLSLI